jgi:hypothetical protein
MLPQGGQAPAGSWPATEAAAATAQQMQELSVHPGDECGSLLTTSDMLQHSVLQQVKALKCTRPVLAADVPTQAVQQKGQPRRQKRASCSMDVQSPSPTAEKSGAAGAQLASSLCAAVRWPLHPCLQHTSQASPVLWLTYHSMTGVVRLLQSQRRLSARLQSASSRRRLAVWPAAAAACPA